MPILVVFIFAVLFGLVGLAWVPVIFLLSVCVGKFLASFRYLSTASPAPAGLETAASKPSLHTREVRPPSPGTVELPLPRLFEREGRAPLVAVPRLEADSGESSQDERFRAAAEALLEGRLAEAGADLELLLTDNPRDTGVLTNLGLCRLLEDRPAEAVWPLTRAVALEPRRIELRENLGTVLHRLGRYQEARNHFAEVVSLARAKPGADWRFYQNLLDRYDREHPW